MKIRLSKKLLLAIVLAVLVAGLASLISGLVYVPALARFQLTGVLKPDRTEFRPGERITVEPFLNYTGMRQVTIFSGTPFFFVDVYTADNVRVFQLPVPGRTLDIALSYTLTPNVPYNDKDVRTHYGDTYWTYRAKYRFRLEQPGSYKVVVWADFWLKGEDPATDRRLYSEPIWITITG